jgi:quercetin dioxygenase-like cupin family protein
MATFLNLSDAPGFVLADGVRACPIFGERAMLNLVDLEPGGVVAEHSHPHEQLGMVVTGELTLVVDGVDHVLGPFDAYALPGDVRHGARAGSAGCRILDIFSPVREDYRERARKA